MTTDSSLMAVKSVRDVDKSLLDLFWKLVETSAEVRIHAAKSMIHLLHQKQEIFLVDHTDAICPELKYSVERLVKGISSSRKAARQGYTLVLTEILKLFPAVTVTEVLSLMDKHLPLSNKQDKSHMVIGQLLTYSAIIRSGRLKEDLESLPAVVVQVYLLALGKCYIQETTYRLISYLFTEISEENFKELIWPKIKKKLSCGWETCSPDMFWFLLLCHRIFPHTTAKFLLKNWGSKDILSSEHFENLQKIVKQSTNVLPQFSPVCSELLHFVLQKKKFKKFWNALFDEALFKSDQNEKTYLGFKVVKAALSMAASKKLVSSILSPNFSSAFTRCLQSSKHPMNSAALELAGFLGNYVKEHSDPHDQIAILRTFIQPPGTVLLEHMLNRKEVSVVINNFSYEAVKLYYKVLQNLILQKTSSDKEEEDDQEYVNWKQCQAITQVGNLVSHLAILSDTDWRLQVTKFLFLHSFFEIHEATEDIDCEWIPYCGSEIDSLHPSVRQVCMHSFHRALDSLNRRVDNSIPYSPLDQHVLVLESIVEFAERLLQSPDKIKPIQPSEKILDPWNNVMNTIKKLTKLGKKSGKKTETAAFKIFFLQLSLQLFSNEDNHVSDVLEELQVYCKKALKIKKETTSPSDDQEWVLGIVDTIISLLSRESLHMRRVVNSFFSLITPFMTQEAMQLILDVLDPEAKPEDFVAAESEDDDTLQEKTPSLLDENDGNVKFASRKNRGKKTKNDDAEGQMNKKGEEDQNFKLKIRNALGTLADVSDAESEVLTDSDATQLDAFVKKIFQEQTKLGHLQFTSKQKFLMHLRTKCLDLISIYVKSEPLMSIVLRCILPVVSIYHFGLHNRHQEALAQKACSTLELLVKAKKFRNCDEVEFDEVREILKDLIDIANQRFNTPLSGKLLNSLCVYMILCERKLEASHQEKETKLKKPVLPSCMDQFKTALNAFVNEIRCSLTPQLFVALMNACPETAWSFVKFFLDSAFDPNVRLFKRAQCLGLLVSSLRFSKGQKDITSEMWLGVFETVVAKATEALSGMLLNESNIKPMYTAELLEVLITVLQLNKEKCDGAWVINKKEELLKALTELSSVHRKRLAQQGKRSLNKLIRLLGGEIPVMKQSEKKRKVSKNEDNNSSESNKKIRFEGNDDESKNGELENEKIVSSTASDDDDISDR